MAFKNPKKQMKELEFCQTFISGYSKQAPDPKKEHKPSRITEYKLS
jgi:hypothetical protein